MLDRFKNFVVYSKGKYHPIIGLIGPPIDLNDRWENKFNPKPWIKLLKKEKKMSCEKNFEQDIHKRERLIEKELRVKRYNSLLNNK